MADTVEKTEVIYGDRGRGWYDDYPRRGGCNEGGWGAVGGALVGGGFGAAAVSVWDKVNDVKANVESVKAAVRESEAGIYKDMARSAEATNQRVDGTAREVLNNRFTTERGLCDLGYKINSDIRDSRDAFNSMGRDIMERLYSMIRDQADCCCETKNLIREVKNDLALQMERCCCDLKRGQDNLACLIKDQAKDQEIARLNRELERQSDRELNQKLNFLIQREVGTGGAAVAAAQQ